MKRYAQGGSVKGAHGIDKVAAKLTAGEYVLPTKTVQAMGTPALDNLVQQTNGEDPGGKPVDDQPDAPRQGVLTKARGVLGYASGGLVIPDNLQPKNLNTDPVTGAQLLARMGTPGFESAPGSSLPPESSAAPAPIAPARIGINAGAASPPVNNSTPNAQPAQKQITTATAPAVDQASPEAGTVQKIVNGRTTYAASAPASNGSATTAPVGLGINQTPSPADAIKLGLEQQGTYAAQERAAILKAANDAAQAGSPGNATARYNAALHALTALSGSNNFGVVQEQGATGAATNQTNLLAAKARAELESATAKTETLKGNEQQQMLDLQKKIEDPALSDADRGRALQAYYRRTGKGPFQFGVNPLTQEPYAGNSLTGEIKTPNSSGTAASATPPVEGATATSNGHPMVFRGGQWQPVATAK